jgi:hypothetical protein
MPGPVSYVPLVTTVVALVFSWKVFQRYRARGGPHLAWWSAGIMTFAVGTFTEGFVTLLGWNPGIFRAWYISGALLGGAPMAQGTVYLLLRRRTANILTAVLVPTIVVAAICVLASPLDLSQVEPYRLSGDVLAWYWVRLFSPFINTYALFYLAGGAILSAYRFKKNPITYHRFVGNVLIAVGAVLPAIGGSFTRFGYTEVLYVTELVGLVLIYTGYRFNVRQKVAERSPALAKGVPA